MTDLQGSKVAFLVAPEGVEQQELAAPWEVVTQAGATARLILTEPGTAQAFRHLDRSDTFPVDAVAGEVSAGDFDALVLPGGVANPDLLRVNSEAVDFVRSFFAAGKPVAVICHGPWTLIEAGVLSGRTLTSWPSLRTDLLNAGAAWVDQEVHVCTQGPNVLISSRKPDDLPAFGKTLIEHLGS
ncbi:type 1 glutamine amidotransferase domain-containing protein [Kitasatospora sp. GP82]|uniref:type 1 glutamine amidotransferase domain-containing protein n=1 Tax=Kitasatospora sp. GP82 TaxID=3035089 RepID=UPI002474F12C|nr:type 1 glutamine amidotransferase domain-containing protein [Kitasatospora sp. GP82]MDH6129030.1 protease I [Kitasatospora sp. GP82]